MTKNKADEVHLTHDDKTINKILSAYGANVLSNEIIKMSDEKKKKTKHYTVITTQLGIFILSRPKIRRKIKMYNFISYFDVDSFEFLSTSGQILCKYSKEQSLTMEFQEPAKFVNTFLENYLNFLGKSPYFKLIDIINPPAEITSQSRPKTVPNDTITTHYFAACAKYNQPFDPETKNLFDLFQNTDHFSFTFTGQCATPANYQMVALPLIHEQKLRILIFDGYAPKLVCKIIYKVLKFNNRITTIIMKNYDNNISFELFGFANLKNPSVVSWFFTGCSFDDVRMIALTNEFKAYTGNIQKLSVDHFRFTPQTADRFSQSVATSYCFRTLEIFEVTNPILNVSESAPVLNSFVLAVSFLKALQQFVAEGFNPPPVIKPREATVKKPLSFIKTSSVRHLTLGNTDLREVVCEVNLPNSVNVIEFPNCTFTSSSLINILKSLQNVRTPLVLNISSLIMDQQETKFFNQAISDLPELSNIVEIDFSNNTMEPKLISEYCRIFLPSGIRFVALNNCFGPQQLTLVHRIFVHLANTSIWGIELRGGNPKTTFKDIMKAVIPGLMRLKTLEYIDISFQQWFPSIGNDFFPFLKNLKLLKYLSIDGSSFLDMSSLLMFYQYVFDKTSVVSVAVPNVDLLELTQQQAGDQTPAGAPQPTFETDPTYEKLQARIRQCIPPPNRLIRSSYYIRYTDMTKFQEFHAKFPISANEIPMKDQFKMVFLNPQQISLRSLLDFELTEAADSLANAQVKCTEAPWDEVEDKRRDKTQFLVPKVLKSFKGKYTFTEGISRPTIQPRVNSKEIMTKYRGWICSKNQRMFRNLSMISALFSKVSEDGDNNSGSTQNSNGSMTGISAGEEFGKKVPIIDPPYFVSREAIKIISTQLESIADGNDDEEKSFEETSFNSSYMSSPKEVSTESVYNHMLSSTYGSTQNSGESSVAVSDNEENELTYIPSLISPMAIPAMLPKRNRRARKTGQLELVTFLEGSGSMARNELLLEDEEGMGEHEREEELDFAGLDKVIENDKRVEPHQIEALHNIRAFAKILASTKPPRRVKVFPIPESAPSLNPNLKDIYDSQIGLARKMCPAVAQPPSPSQKIHIITASSIAAAASMTQKSLLGSTTTSASMTATNSSSSTPTSTNSYAQSPPMISPLDEASSNIINSANGQNRRLSLIPDEFNSVGSTGGGGKHGYSRRTTLNKTASTGKMIKPQQMSNFGTANKPDSTRNYGTNISSQPLAGFASLSSIGSDQQQGKMSSSPFNSNSSGNSRQASQPQSLGSAQVNPPRIQQFSSIQQMPPLQQQPFQPLQQPPQSVKPASTLPTEILTLPPVCWGIERQSSYTEGVVCDGSLLNSNNNSNNNNGMAVANSGGIPMVIIPPMMNNNNNSAAAPVNASAVVNAKRKSNPSVSPMGSYGAIPPPLYANSILSDDLTQHEDIESDVEEINDQVPQDNNAAVDPETIPKAPAVITNKYTKFSRTQPPDVENF